MACRKKALMVYNSDIAYAEEKGRDEEKLELIRNMIDKGYVYASIFEITEKSVEEIKEIEQSLTS